MRGNLRCPYQWATSRWAVASGGCKPGVKQLALKGTGEARCKPPRGRAWLRECMVSQRSDKRPTGNRPPATLYLAYLASTTRSTGQRPHPMVLYVPKDDRGWTRFIASPKDVRGQLGLPPDRSGYREERDWLQSPPKHFRRVHCHERGRLWCACEGEQSTEDIPERRRRHSTRKAGKPSTWGRTPGD
jgi:hypothetical protein